MPKPHNFHSALSRTFRGGPAVAAPLAPTENGGALWDIRPIETAAIRVENRLRAVLDDAKIEAIAASLTTLGLASPIIVRQAESGDDYTLVAGTHRLEAARRLGWERIDARIVEGTPDQIRLIEIDENLARAELTVLDQARSLAEAKTIYARHNLGTRHGGDRTRPTGDQSDTEQRSGLVAVRSFAADAGDLLGLSERSVRRYVEIGEGLEPDVADALAETPIARREGDLRKIAAKPAEEQRALIETIRSRDEPPKALADLEPPKTPQAPDRGAQDPSPPALGALAGAPPTLEALQDAWNTADPDTREAFRRWLDEQTEGAPQ